MAFLFNLIGGKKLTLETTALAVAGVDSSANPQLLKVNSNGELIVAAGGGFDIPDYNNLAITYVGSTNNIRTVVYKMGTAAVATLTMAYTVEPPTSDNAKLSTVTKT